MKTLKILSIMVFITFSVAGMAYSQEERPVANSTVNIINANQMGIQVKGITATPPNVKEVLIKKIIPSWWRVLPTQVTKIAIKDLAGRLRVSPKEIEVLGKIY